ncbi:fibronectin type III domain-containing protein [Cystobacter fuscus]
MKWAPPADPEGAVPPLHPATGYRLYQSVDGLAWDEGTDTTATSFSLPLAAGTTRYFRVAAVNEGGESFPSDVVGVGATDGAPRVLVVNAFQALDATMARVEELSAYDLGSPQRAFLEAMNDGTALRRHGDALARNAVAFDGATGEAIAAGLITPVGYPVLDWFSGRGQARSRGPDATEQALLRAFVLGGGHLLLSGSQVASALAVGSAEDVAFLTDILHARPVCGLSAPRVGGLAEGLFPGLAGSLLDDGRRGSFPVGATDVLRPGEGGQPVLGYSGADTAAGILSAPGGQVLFLGVPFEGVVSPERRAYLMGAFLARAGVLASPPPAPETEEALPLDLDSGGLSSPGAHSRAPSSRSPAPMARSGAAAAVGRGGNGFPGGAVAVASCATPADTSFGSRRALTRVPPMPTVARLFVPAPFPAQGA